MGINQVPLNLLDHQEEDHKAHRLPGVRHGNQQRPHHAANEGPHHGNQGRQGNEDPHQQGVGHAEHRHGRHKEGPQNHRLHALAGEEAGKRASREAENLQAPVRPGPGQEGVEDLAALPGQALLLQEDVKREDQPDDKGADSADHPRHQNPAGGHQPAAPVPDQGDRLFRESLPVEFQARREGLQLGEPGLHRLQPLLHPLDGGGQLAGDGTDRAANPRADDAGRQGHHARHSRQGQDEGQGTAEGLPPPPPGEAGLDGPHGDV